MRDRLHSRPLFYILGAMISVQYGAAIAKQLFATAGPIWTATLRICFSAVMLAIAFRPNLTRMTAAQWRAVIPYGIVLGTMNLLFYLALSRIPLGLAVAIEFTGPLLVALLGSKRFLDLVWAVLAATGIILITPHGGAHGAQPTGVLLALSAGALWAAYIVLGRRVSNVFRGATGVAVGMMIATLAILPFVPLAGIKLPLEPHVVLGSVAVAALSSALPYSLEMLALRAMAARTFGILMSLEPAIGAACGWLILHEKLSPTQLLAVALIIVASAGTTVTAKRIDAPVEA